MDQVLAQIVADRLAADASVAEDVRERVLAAFGSDEDLSERLEGTADPVGAYLQSVTVEGFRGVGPPTQLDLTPGPGLVLVVGRNGSGKSSLAEGLELLLTGDCRRWTGRSQMWKEGWRNLHHHGPTRIQAEFVEEGHDAPTTVCRTWEHDTELEDGHVEVRRPNHTVEELSSFGWSTALDAYRPFLSYNELGSMLDEAPSKLYDAMASILGLEDLVAADRRLGDERRSREKESKEVTASLKPLLARLAEVDDDRARRCLHALSGRRPDLDAAELAINVTDSEEAAGDVEVLRQLSRLQAPDLDAATAVAAALRQAVAAAAELQGTDADHARRTCAILTAALDLHDAHGDGDCPVCSRSDALDHEWRERAGAEVDRLSQLAREADAVEALLATALRAAAELRSGPPAALDRAAELGIDPSAAVAAWKELAHADGDDPEAVATALESVVPQLGEAVGAVRDAANRELRRREDSWRPLALQVAAWLEHARADETAARELPALKKAERWLKDAAQDLRNERFAPIAHEAARVWSLLRVQSNVNLGRVELSGSATQRKVVLAVTVDGSEGGALGVMSQGELHSLALSLFLPRATLPDSPFRFLVIDDPVQSMDPARVDGLARLLDETARRRQVLVFTHDDRLAEAVRRLGIDATVWEVGRREQSVVELRPSLDPVRRHLDDALALARSDAELPAKIGDNVVPGFCRNAVEAACAETIRRRRLGRGDRHVDVEQLLAHVTSTTEWVALAVFDDRASHAEVLARVQGLGPRAAETLEACTSGELGTYSGSLVELVRDASLLAEKLRGGVLVGETRMATVLFTDIVSSAERASSLGDQRWRGLLDEHRRIANDRVARGQGVLVKETGDGVLATFDSPARAVRAARAMCEAVGTLGLQLRAGLHTGEVERRGDDISGLAVVIARRICDQAAADCVLVSRTVTEMTVGSGLRFTESGTHDLKGVPGRWPLFSVRDDDSL